MGNTSAVCTYIDPCNTLCDKKQILFYNSERETPIIIDNSQSRSKSENNPGTKKIVNKQLKKSIGKNSVNEKDLNPKNNRCSIISSYINTNIYRALNSNIPNTKMNNSNIINISINKNLIKNNNNKNYNISSFNNKQKIQNQNEKKEIKVEKKNDKNNLVIKKNENKSIGEELEEVDDKNNNKIIKDKDNKNELLLDKSKFETNKNLIMIKKIL